MYWVEPKKVSLVAGLPLMVGHMRRALVLGSWYVGSFFIRRQMTRGVLYAVAVFVYHVDDVVCRSPSIQPGSRLSGLQRRQRHLDL